jgi:hypothetical protein
MRMPLVNRGFVYGSAGAIAFILAKVAKYGGSSGGNEALIYCAVVLSGGLLGALLWLGCRLVFGRSRDRKPPRRSNDQGTCS